MNNISGDDVHTDGSSNFPEQDMILHPLADELIAIAARLRDAATSPPKEASDRPQSRTTRNHLALARKTYALRRKRAAIFGNPDLFGEPAWDILLDLFIAHGEGKPVSVSSACIGSASPATTGLRWLGVLADEGLIVRENDADDNRRVLVRLSSAGVTAMERFLDSVQDEGL
jgi:hypothetical protein